MSEGAGRCRGKPGCVDELRSNAARAYIALLPKPLRFERVDEVLTTNGSLHSVLLNRVPIKMRKVAERLLFTATGPDKGRRPFKSLHVGDAGADADLSVSGIDYVCW